MSPGAPLLARETRTRNPPTKQPLAIIESGGPDRDRTDDLLDANQALSQLSYGPMHSVPIPQWEVDSSLSPCSRMAPARFRSRRLDLLDANQALPSKLRARKNGRPNTLVKGARASLKTG